MADNSIIEKVSGTDSSSNRIASTFYCTCSTAAGTAQKDATPSDSCVFNNNCLITGVTVHVKFTNSNTHATPTLKVGTATAKDIKAYGTTKPGTSAISSWYAGSVVSFTYDGTYWQMNDYKENTDTNDSVSQINTTANANYRVLLSHSANNDTETAGAYKNQGLYFNTSSGILYPYRTVVADYLTTPKLNGFECGPSLEEFKAALGIKDLLWENTNAFTSAFAAQTVSINLSSYSEIIIDYVNYKNNGTTAYSNEIRSSGLVVGKGATYLIAVLDTFYRRSVTVTTSGVTFSGAYQEGTYNKWSGSWGVDNNAVVPYRIWGWNPPVYIG